MNSDVNNTHSVKILHIVSFSFVINHFFGKQFLYLSNINGNEYHLGSSPSEHFFSLSKTHGFKPLVVNIRRSITPIEDLKAIYIIFRYIKKNKIDKVVGHTPKGGMIAMIAAKLAGVKYRIYFRHGLVYETSNGFLKLILKNIERLSGYLATDVVCVSNEIKFLSEKNKLSKAGKNLVLGSGTCNGIDTRVKFNPDRIQYHSRISLKEKIGLPEDCKVIGFVGRIVRDKGIEDLILAWQLVKKTNHRVKLLLVGPFEERDSIKEITKSYIKNDPDIIHTDLVPDSAPYFSLMDIFVLPTYREGFPTVSLEASSMRIPVLITQATGCSEAIINNETGMFISNSPEDISSKIIYYLNNELIAKTHGEQGRIFVQKNFEQVKIWEIIRKDLKL